MGGGGSDPEAGRISVDLVEAGWPAEVVEPRRADRGGGESIAGGSAIVRARWGMAIEGCGLASCAPCRPWGIVGGANSVCC